ncbi:MAG TPA: hypothetical protein VGU45_01500 [Microvirga sp.]|jgi:hypothetical protein|nr:hypothetical protein [Microvirga sp.]
MAAAYALLAASAAGTTLALAYVGLISWGLAFLLTPLVGCAAVLFVALFIVCPTRSLTAPFSETIHEPR